MSGTHRLLRRLAALCVAYLDHALTHPDLYRVMLDASVDLEITSVADGGAEAVVTLGATDDFALGRLVQRLVVSAASEDLTAEVLGAPTGEHTVAARLSPVR